MPGNVRLVPRVIISAKSPYPATFGFQFRKSTCGSPASFAIAISSLFGKYDPTPRWYARSDKKVRAAGDVPRRSGLPLLATLPARVKPRFDDVFPPYGTGGRTFNRLRNEVLASLRLDDQVIVVTGASNGNASALVTFMARREALTGGLGLVAEEAPGSQNEDWDMLLRAAKRAPIIHVDEPLVRVLWASTSHFAYEYATKISSLRWMMSRHPEIRGCRPGAARVYGQLACWSAASGNRRDAWHFTRQAVRNNWKEPRAAIAIAAATGVMSVDRVLGALHKRGHGI